MKHKVSELEGALLDAAVAHAQGRKFRIMDTISEDYRRRFDACYVAKTHGWDRRGTDYGHFNPSYDWRDGGPIIDRERISTAWNSVPSDPMPWCACYDDASGYSYGPTLLVAAMRRFVASKLGDEVDL